MSSRRDFDTFSGPTERVGLDPKSPWLAEHLARYHFASKFVQDRRVLDIACGTGIGYPVLREAGPAFVAGIDVALEGLVHARERGFDLALCQGDAHAIPLRGSCVDTALTFETLEHLVDPERFLDELRRVLVPRGSMLLSTPNALYTRPENGVPKNPFHVHEYTPKELLSLLQRFFSVDDLMVQRVDPELGMSPYWDLDEWLRKDFAARARLLSWRIQNRLPWSVKNWLSRTIHGRSFYPNEHDFVFTSTDLKRGHVLMAVCTA